MYKFVALFIGSLFHLYLIGRLSGIYKNKITYHLILVLISTVISFFSYQYLIKPRPDSVQVEKNLDNLLMSRCKTAVKVSNITDKQSDHITRIIYYSFSMKSTEFISLIRKYRYQKIDDYRLSSLRTNIVDLDSYERDVPFTEYVKKDNVYNVSRYIPEIFIPDEVQKIYGGRWNDVLIYVPVTSYNDQFIQYFVIYDPLEEKGLACSQIIKTQCY